MSRRAFLVWLLVILATGTTLRTLWLRADPPQISVTGVGVVWHDEGAWTHNARNRALWGVWRTDEWNPVYVAPVFTALEYVSFREFGVGLWQARLVPVISGLVAIVFLAAGLAAAANRRAALVGAALLAVNYAFVMWNRAALMESTMAAFIVIGWAAYALAERRAAWGVVAGAAVVLAWFTKAAAAFFAAAIVIDALKTIVLAEVPALRVRAGVAAPEPSQVRGAVITLASLAISAVVVGALFVWPHWTDYRFYNWQMSVLRKPEYDLRHFLDRATWLPIVQAIFMRMSPVVAISAVSLLAIVARWRTARPAERLLVFWMLIGLLELVVHDSGNDRRYVMFIPAMIALASLMAGGHQSVLPADLAGRAGARLMALPLLLFFGYIVAGSFIRPAFLEDIAANHFHRVVVASAGAAGLMSLLIVWQWRRLVGWLGAGPPPWRLVLVLLALAVGLNVVEYARWAGGRSELNYEASVALGRLLPPDTLVQGKLANGLALDNRIKPLFIGNHFGNYDDRLQRDDARYILTYDLPSVGYESQADSGLIQELLDRYPQHHTIATFAVDETPAVDRAALIEKRPK
ncbi:MAG TPA: glycosyltransferase family 39 protein [Vicinamibacterales bacterium]|nr:glycosyltransferase family 39 protein [Vicinamibacterales bacterium]